MFVLLLEQADAPSKHDADGVASGCLKRLSHKTRLYSCPSPRVIISGITPPPSQALGKKAMKENAKSENRKDTPSRTWLHALPYFASPHLALPCLVWPAPSLPSPAPRRNVPARPVPPPTLQHVQHDSNTENQHERCVHCFCCV